MAAAHSPQCPPTPPAARAAAGDGDANGGDESVELSFVDLLYAVPVADLAVRVSATTLHHVTPSGWTDITLTLIIITFGWIGHHTNRRNLPPSLRDSRDERERPFTTARFPQFIVEILIVVVYFALGTRSVLPHGAGVGHPGTLWKAKCVLTVFILYFVWDVLDVYITKVHAPQETLWARKAKRGGSVTFGFIFVFAAVTFLWATNDPRPDSVVGFDLVLILLLFFYRVIQQSVVLGTRPRPIRHARCAVRRLRQG